MLVVKRYVLLASAVAACLLFCGGVEESVVEAAQRDGPAADDDISGYAPSTQDLYRSVADLLLYRIDTWSKSDDRDLASVSYYLGFRPVTRNLLDFAMTELMHVERASPSNVNIANLVELYFYACDVENVRDYGRGELAAVTDRFRGFLTRFRYAAGGQTTADLELVRLQNVLKCSARIVTWKSKNAYTVTVPLMKNRMFTDRQSDSETVRRLQRRFAGEHTAARETETDGKAVIGYHLRVLGKIIPDVFAFFYDHVSMMGDLLLRDDQEENDSTLRTVAQNFAPAVVLFKELMVDRYFEMNTGASRAYEDSFQAFRKDLAGLANQLNPDLNSWTDRQKYADKRAYIDDVTRLVKNRLAAMLQLFGSESVEDWHENRTIKVAYSAAEVTGKRLMELWRNNTLEAMDFLCIFIIHQLNPIPKISDDPVF